jgi:hypothetical protein
MKKLRLILTDICNRDCDGCSNKWFDISELPVCTSFRGYDEIIFTGGEPMLFPEVTWAAAARARGQAAGLVPIYVYTALPRAISAIERTLYITDGICLTIHEQGDVADFNTLQRRLGRYEWVREKSMRLNVFRGVTGYSPLPWWKVKEDIVWIRDCSMPEGEVLMRWEYPELV